MERELTLAHVYHPPFIDDWALVDHPTLRPIANGEPTLGWEGDQRLAVYLHNATKTFVLWRLEADNEYRPVAKLPSGASITPESVNTLIRQLIWHDTRRGFDAIAEVEKAQAERDAEIDTERREAVMGMADKLQFGLAHSHMPGVDITRPRQVLSRR